MSVAFNEVEYDSSETSDDDYVPSGGEQLSEEENSGEEEDIEATIKDNAQNKSRKGTKRKAKVTAQSRKRKGGIKLDDEVSAPVEEEDDYNKQLSEQISKEHEEKKIGDEKKKADDLWSDFMKDVGSPPARQKSASDSSSLTKTTKLTPLKSAAKKPANIFKDDLTGPKPSKVTVTKEYDFAGEIVKVTKEVDAGSKEAKNVNQTTTCTSSSSTDSKPGISGVRKSGLGSVLGKIGIKPKISTLEKSRLDWDGYKKKEGIEEELKIHNRGKEGYIERKQFLERTDLRQFELEKNMRLKTSKGGVFSVDS